MKFFWSLALLAVLAVCQINAEYSEEEIYVLGDPDSAELNSNELVEVSEGDSSELDSVEEQTVGLRRYKRATCDLLSGLKINHSACAAHCILKKYKGGYCNSRGICVCRN